MASKSKKFETRTILVIILVLLIAVAAYMVISNLPESRDFKSPDEVSRNIADYLNKTILVKGFYDIDGNEDVVVSTMDTTEGRITLSLDLSGFENNETDVLETGNKYIFTGTLVYEIENNPISPVIFVVEKIEIV